MIIKAWGVLEHTPMHLSDTMRRLNVSHSVMNSDGPHIQYTEVDGLCQEQPAWPVIMHSLADLSRVKRVGRERIIAFVFDSHSAITSTNLSIWSPCLDMYAELPGLLQQEDKRPFELKIREYSAMDYIELASKPSFLSQLHGTWCRVNPYDLRKRVEAAVVQYLMGKKSLGATKSILNQTLRGEELIGLLHDPACAALKNCIARVAVDGEDAEMVADEANIDAFDITYVINSARKAK